MKPDHKMPGARGVYSEVATAALEEADPSQEQAVGRFSADRNIFEWYEDKLPAHLPEAHIIDWGAGPGRFAPLYLRRHPKRLTLVEPSPSGYARLLAKYGQNPNVDLLNASIGTSVARYAAHRDVLHLCNFVVNCLDSPHQAFELLSASIQESERLIVFTNAFIPPALARQVRWEHVFDETAFDMQSVTSYSARVPQSRTFSNEIIESGVILTDSVHLITEYAELLRQGPWNVVKTSLLPPCGFRHVLQPDDDFGDMVFAVLILELEKHSGQ